jgi:hypothetical protein
MPVVGLGQIFQSSQPKAKQCGICNLSKSSQQFSTVANNLEHIPTLSMPISTLKRVLPKIIGRL